MSLVLHTDQYKKRCKIKYERKLILVITPVQIQCRTPTLVFCRDPLRKRLIKTR